MASKFLVSSMLLLAVSPGVFSETPEDPETVIRCQAGIDDPVGPFDLKFRFTDTDDNHIPFSFTLRYGPNSHTVIPFNGTVDSYGDLYFDEDGSFYGVDLDFSAEFDYHLFHHWEVADEAHFAVGGKHYFGTEQLSNSDDLFDLLGVLDLGCLDFSKYCHVSDRSLTPQGPEGHELTRLTLICGEPWEDCHLEPRSLTRREQDSASQSLCLTPRGAILCMAERARRGNSSQ
ncbi:hypothetical protein NM208_g15083 [Fusarium decemcellulare]|uniref:Uncharacterized protein n=1 Tax=Fusarium decemcellulare TaxID=57161 RepID=A0ACC1RE39_9HYPO|nr:hypothetical protein NM208_g15083 [Fusarium decemcellulare]